MQFQMLYKSSIKELEKNIDNSTIKCFEIIEANLKYVLSSTQKQSDFGIQEGFIATTDVIYTINKLNLSISLLKKNVLEYVRDFSITK